jgi:uncharacterized membrane protein
MKAVDFFSAADKEKISMAVQSAEKLTSGEIRVYIEDTTKDEVMDRAAFIFSEMQMHKTDLRNGVLIYVAFSDHKFAVIGDAGIHAKVGQDFWNSTKELMLQHFKNKQFTEGVIAGIKEAGRVLVQHFPCQDNDSNELSDDVVIK